MKLWRSVLTGIFFAAFGIGGLAIGWVAFPVLSALGRRRAMRRLVRWSYRLFTAAADITGLFRVEMSKDDRAALANAAGCLVVANHPTLIDVVVLIALLPDATSIAKLAAGRNPFYSRIVEGAFILREDAGAALERASAALAEGTSVIVFPEGTRTPIEGETVFRRGAGRIAVEAQVRALCVRIDPEPRMLAKGQPWWDVGDRTIRYRVSVVGDFPPPGDTASARAASVDLTERFRRSLFCA